MTTGFVGAGKVRRQRGSHVLSLVSCKRQYRAIVFSLLTSAAGRDGLPTDFQQFLYRALFEYIPRPICRQQQCYSDGPPVVSHPHQTPGPTYFVLSKLKLGCLPPEFTPSSKVLNSHS